MSKSVASSSEDAVTKAMSVANLESRLELLGNLVGRVVILYQRPVFARAFT